MVLYKIILTFSLIMLVESLPINETSKEDSSEERGLEANDLFHQLNIILEQNIASALGGHAVHLGDKIKGSNSTGGIQISVQQFSYENNSFPLTFKPHNESVVDDKEITPVRGDFDDSAVYKIESDGSEEYEDSDEEEEEDDTTVIPTKLAQSTPKYKRTTTRSKDKKLLSDIAAQPILLTV